MINKLIEGLYGFIFEFVGLFTQPVSDFLNNTIPDLSSFISTVNTFMNSIYGILQWFVYLIPRPFTLAALYAFCVAIITSAGTVFTFWLLGLTIDFVKRLNIFGSK